ncbi:MAG: sugar-binding protein [Kofleriaceae bacterium]
MRGVLAIVVLAGCYGPTFPDGVACTTSRECPGALTCSHGLCVTHAPTDDGGSGSDAAACTPIVVGPGALTAPRVTTIAIDGDLSDWPTCFVTLDAHTAIVRDITGLGDYSTGKFSVAHDATRVYLAAEVTGVAPLGDQPVPAIYQNDSISIYLDADGVFTTAAYDPDAMQLVIDHAGRIQGFRNGALVAANLTTATRSVGTTFTIEVALQPSTLSAAAFASTIGFDIGFESGDGTTQTSELVWFESCGPPACGCTDGSSAPFCDARQLGTAALAP